MNDLSTYIKARKKVLPFWNKLSEEKKEKSLYALGMLFGEYQHLKTFTNRKYAFRGNSVLDSNLKIENLDFWAEMQLNGYYPKLTQQQKETFINAANGWYTKQFGKMGVAKQYKRTIIIFADMLYSCCNQGDMK